MHETKLGQLIDQNAGRDAVHVALAPVVAYERLLPGEHIGFVDPLDTTLAGSANSCDKTLGIVDPYLRKAVSKGERFFMCLYPQTTTGLRHVWTHPAFPEGPPKVAMVDDAKTAAVKRITEIAEMLGDDFGTYDELMNHVQACIKGGDHFVEYGTEHLRDTWYGVEDEFWKCFETITGQKKPIEHVAIFCCSC